MGKFLAASGLAAGLALVLLCTPSRVLAGAPVTDQAPQTTPQTLVELSLELPPGAAGHAHDGILMCADGKARPVHIGPSGRARITDAPRGLCSLELDFEGHRYAGAVTIDGHTHVAVAFADRGEIVEAAPAAGVDMDSARGIPLGVSMGREFTAAVELVPIAGRHAVGVSTSAGSGGGLPFQAGTLTAGAVDDLADAKSFARFLNQAGQIEGANAVGKDWAAVRVVDRAGRPLPGVAVRVAGRELVTRADGRVVFVGAYDRIPELAHASATVDGHRRVRLRPGKTSSVTLSRVAANASRADVLLVLDTTGSMGDELNYLQVELRAILDEIKRKHPGVDLRWGLVVYRDQGDAYVARGADFTRDFSAFEATLASHHAGGGGDMPEAVHSAFALATQLSWRPAADAARIVLHVADAPPHVDKTLDAFEHVDTLRAAGTAIYPVAASGLDAQGEFFMRSAALMTGGQYLFLTDDSGYGGSHREATAACFRVNTLASVLQRVLDAELRGRRPRLPRGERGDACTPVGVSRQAPGPGRRSVSRSLFDDDAAAVYLHQPYVRRKIH